MLIGWVTAPLPDCWEVIGFRTGTRREVVVGCEEWGWGALWIVVTHTGDHEVLDVSASVCLYVCRVVGVQGHI